MVGSSPSAENTARKQREVRSGPAGGDNPQARPGYRERANCIEKFANRRNSHCVTMALFEHAKLANLLMCKAFHSSLGSAIPTDLLDELSRLRWGR
jgi:hypothetical protein